MLNNSIAVLNCLRKTTFSYTFWHICHILLVNIVPLIIFQNGFSLQIAHNCLKNLTVETVLGVQHLVILLLFKIYKNIEIEMHIQSFEDYIKTTFNNNRLGSSNFNSSNIIFLDTCSLFYKFFTFAINAMIFVYSLSLSFIKPPQIQKISPGYLHCAHYICTYKLLLCILTRHLPLQFLDKIHTKGLLKCSLTIK